MKQLIENIVNIYQDRGRDWLDQLPHTIQLLSTLWGLENASPVENMSFHYVAKATSSIGQPVVLKIGCDGKSIRNEKIALEYFNGHGAIKLIHHSEKYHALLLQQALPGNSLKSLYPLQADDVIHCYADVVKRLHKKRLSHDHHYPHVRSWLSSLDVEESSKLPVELLKKARNLRDALLSTMDQEVFLHGDLHHDNVISNGNEWIVIDPKGIVGDAEFEVAAFDFIHPTEMKKTEIKNLFNHRVHRLAKKANLSEQRIQDWVFVRLMLSAAWSVEDNGSPERALQLVDKLYYSDSSA